ncbi:hypothetical protein ElyMa_002509900 [Elysia marginata]|uniref:Uncharacterized protein n=1 Tax=Elysia marginata TaxID=1093978 RepID=A0AAV4GQI9_9GAST|nr:hypothetical protein ElyMa_002509900 [Elysia marginata]
MTSGGVSLNNEILFKLEETDPKLVAGVSRDVEDDYDQYVRGEIVDWSPDTPFLESDHTRRNPAVPQTILNLRYAGGRGPNNHPHHSELFLGFTGNDPRGASTQPRLDKIRAQTVTRASPRKVQMGHNVGHGDFIEADRPWSGAAMEYNKKEVQRRVKDHMHWFSAQKVDLPRGHKTIADERRQRYEVVKSGEDGLCVPEQDRGLQSWLQRGEYDPVRGAEGDNSRRVDRAANAETAPWRNISGAAGLAVARYTVSTRSGRETFGAKAAGGARAAAAQVDADLAIAHHAATTRGGRDPGSTGGFARVAQVDTDLASARHTISTRGGRETSSPGGTGGARAMTTQVDIGFGAHAHGAAMKRQILADSMGAAAAHRRELHRRQEGDADRGNSVQAQRVGRSAPELARDAAIVVYQGQHDQAMQAAGQNLKGGSGLGAPPSDRQAALYKVSPTHAGPSNVRLANASAMIRGLREGTSAEFRMVQGEAIAAGKMGTSSGGVGMAMAGGGLAPSADYNTALHQGKASSVRAAAAQNLEVHHYGQPLAHLRNPLDVVRSAQTGGFASTRVSHKSRREGRMKAPEFRSHTQDLAARSSDSDRVFGSIGERSDPYTGGFSIGGKTLRVSTLADGGDDTLKSRRFDSLKGMGENLKPHAGGFPTKGKNLRAALVADGETLRNHGFDDFEGMGVHTMGGGLFSASLVGVQA